MPALGPRLAGESRSIEARELEAIAPETAAEAAAAIFLLWLRGDSRVSEFPAGLCPPAGRWTGELSGELVDDVMVLFPLLNKCWRDWLKSMVTLRKKSHTERFLPNSRADLYLQQESQIYLTRPHDDAHE